MPIIQHAHENDNQFNYSRFCFSVRSKVDSGCLGLDAKADRRTAEPYILGQSITAPLRGAEFLPARLERDEPPCEPGRRVGSRQGRPVGAVLSPSSAVHNAGGGRAAHPRFPRVGDAAVLGRGEGASNAIEEAAETPHQPKAAPSPSLGMVVGACASRSFCPIALWRRPAPMRLTFAPTLVLVFTASSGLFGEADF